VGFMLKAFIFDMDGLMFDTEKMLARFWQKAALEYGFEMNEKHSAAIRSTAPMQAEKILKSFFGDDFDYVKIRNRRRELMNMHIEKYGLPKKKGLVEILEYAKKNNLKTAVATATDEKRTKWYLEKENISHYFDFIATTYMVKNPKPAPDIYIYAAHELGFETSQAAAFEDSPNGIESAYKAGCETFMIPDLSDPDERIMKMVNHRCDSLLNAIEIIEKERNGVLI
jgi:HAD superfamily hydrolase (TIGR01509 family)